MLGWPCPPHTSAVHRPQKPSNSTKMKSTRTPDAFNLLSHRQVAKELMSNTDESHSALRLANRADRAQDHSPSAAPPSPRDAVVAPAETGSTITPTVEPPTIRKMPNK